MSSHESGPEISQAAPGLTDNNIIEKSDGAVTFRAYLDLRLLVQYNHKNRLQFPDWVQKKVVLNAMPRDVFNFNYLVDLRGVICDYTDQDVASMTKVDRDFYTKTGDAELLGEIRTAVLVDGNNEEMLNRLRDSYNQAYKTEFTENFHDPSKALSWLGYPDLDPETIDV